MRDKLFDNVRSLATYNSDFLLSTTSQHIFATLTYVQRTKQFPDFSNNKGSPPL